MPSLPVVAIVGRPNVGKSTLFNRLVGERVAIVEDMPGTTRDRVYGTVDWKGRDFTLVDTGGLELEPGRTIEARVQEQARVAIEEADLILFVVDAAAGLAPLDHEVADRLRRPRSRSWSSTRPTTRAASTRAASSTRWASTRRSPSARSTAATPATSPTRSSIGCRPPRHRSRTPVRARTDRRGARRARRDGDGAAEGRDRRPPEHRQVDVRQPRPRRGADDRVRGARHHARPGRQRDRGRWRADDPGRHRRHPPPRARSTAGSSATRCCAPEGDRPRRRGGRHDRCDRGLHRPGRARGRATSSTPARGSCSSSTSGTRSRRTSTPPIAG